MKTKLMTAALAGLLAFAAPATAKDIVSEDMIGGEISANVGFTTEYFFRGLSQSGDGNPAIQGGFDYAHDSGFYLGTWGSSINFGGNIEMDFYAGWSGDLGDGVGIDAGVIYYHYPSSSGQSLDFVEGYVGLGKDFGFASAGVKASYSPDYTVSSGDAIYLEGNVDIPAGEYLTVNLHVGNQTVDDNTAFGFDDYTDWLVGVSFGVLGFDAQIAYTDNDLADSSCTGGCDRLFASLSRSF